MPENNSALLNMDTTYTGTQRTEALQEDPEEVVEEEVSETPQEDEPSDETDWKKRYSDLRSYADKRDNDYKEEIAALKAAAKEATPAWTPPNTDEEMEEFRQNHPDVFNMVETIAHKRADAAVQEARELRQELQEVRMRDKQREGVLTLQKNHPDYFEVYGSDQFQAWKDKQPAHIKEWAGTETDGELASRVLDLFKLDAGITKSESKVEDRKKLKQDAAKLVAKAQGSEVPAPADKPTFTRRQIEAMTAAEFEANEEAIMEARLDGRIIDDKGR